MYEQLCFSASRVDLAHALSKVSGVVEKRNAIDILACVNIKVQHGEIRLMATDLDVSVFASFSGNVLTEGEVKVAAHILHDIIRKLPVEFTINFTVNSTGKLLISCGNANFSLPTVVSNKFPSLDEDNYKHDFALISADLYKLLIKTKFAISLDDTRYNLNGIHMYTDENFLYCVATDSHRLSCVTKTKPREISEKFSVIIPRKAVIELLKILDQSDKVSIKLSERKIKFTCGEYVLISKLIDGTFPDYKSVVPTNYDKHIVIESKKLSDVIDRVSVVVSDKVKSITLSLQEDKLTLYSNSQECSDATESIDIEYKNVSIVIGFNSRYLIDALSCIKNRCKLSFIDGNSATQITDEDDLSVLYIVMPMRT